MYTDFAYAYDRLMNDVPYEAWARYYAGLLELYSIRPGARCVECACGTGSLTIPLAKLGFSMTGMDLSAEMLNLAQQKAREQGMLIPFVRQDMRRLAVQRPVDAVLATCDGPNYLTGSNDLLSFFKQAHAALKPGGVLAFDVSTPYKLASRLGDRIFTSSEDDMVYVWQGQYSEKHHILDIHLDIFAETEGGLYRRIRALLSRNRSPNRKPSRLTIRRVRPQKRQPAISRRARQATTKTAENRKRSRPETLATPRIF